MDKLYNLKPYFLMDDLGVPLFLETPILLRTPVYNIHVSALHHLQNQPEDSEALKFVSQSSLNMFYCVF